jgi:hypothetical protein
MATSKPNFPKITTGFATCVENHVNRFGVFRAGDRVKADHPDIALAPACWADGLLTAEYHAIQARFVAPSTMRTSSSPPVARFASPKRSRGRGVRPLKAVDTRSSTAFQFTH